LYLIPGYGFKSTDTENPESLLENGRSSSVQPCHHFCRIIMGNIGGAQDIVRVPTIIMGNIGGAQGIVRVPTIIMGNIGGAQGIVRVPTILP
jgi:hypothetical protein